jgi:hypothetical protein
VVGAGEALEDGAADVLGDAGAVVLDHEAGGRLVLPEPDGDPAAGPGVQPGVSEQVPGDPAGAVAGRRPS